MRSFSRAILAAGLALASAPLAAQDAADGSDRPPYIGIMTTIPIFWGEPSEFSDELVGSARRLHWAKFLLEERYWLMPVDYLTPGGLDHYDGLILAQPRGLSGEENVAVDDYVRQGGRVLLLADPMMTGHTFWPIGDRRRPQDIALLSPILARWGLELRFDELQGEDLAYRDFDGTRLPVSLAGQFAALGENCTLAAEALVARCRVGEGEVLAVADAAMLDLHGPWDGAEDALLALTESIFPEFGDGAGIDRTIPLQVGDSARNTDNGNTSTMDEVTLIREDSP